MAATPDHFYTTSKVERDGARSLYGYTYEGTACYVYSPAGEPPPSTVPLYRLYIGGEAHDHFLTTSEVERSEAISKYGYAEEGVECYVFPPDQPQPEATVPLYRLYGEAQVDHFYTISPEGRDEAQSESGYKDEGITCYVLADSQNYELQDGWRWCKKCQSLFFDGEPGNVEQSGLRGCLPTLFFSSNELGKCPAGGEHEKSENDIYRLINSDKSVVPLFRLYND